MNLTPLEAYIIFSYLIVIGTTLNKISITNKYSIIIFIMLSPIVLPIKIGIILNNLEV